MLHKTLNVLIADDDKGDCQQIRRALVESTLSAHFTEAGSIQEALDLCERFAFDCALVDYQVPGQDGLSGISVLRERFPEMVIVMVTGQGDELIATEAMKRGASDYLPKKQINADTVSRTLEKALEKAALERAVAEQRDQLVRANHELEKAELLKTVAQQRDELAKANHELERSELLKTVAQQRDELVKANQEKEVLIAHLEQALIDKTLLLKEIHHRVKNNLALVTSLLGLQAATIGEQRFTVAMQESQRRIASMGLIHEFLSSTKNLDRVNMGSYLRQLVSELRSAYSAVADRIEVTIEAEEIELLADHAAPCGLILTELFSNAMKYAFPDDRRGQVAVRLARGASGGIRLTCEDNGIGIPAGFDWRNAKSLGLNIVQALAQQIEGEIAVESSPRGTKFELTFAPASPVKSGSSRAATV